MPLFSVIIPTFNRADLVADALASVFAQQFADFEVIVVDDGSTDGTLAFLRSLPRPLTIVSQSNGGPGSARNAGADRATGEYLAFLDSDDLWFPWTLESFAEVIRAHDRPSYICGSFKQFDSRLDVANESPQPLAADTYRHYFATWPRQFVIGAGMIAVRRDVFLARGGFSTLPINLEDHDLSLKLGVATGFVQIERPVTMGWRLHRGGVTRDLQKSADGCSLLIATERAGGYPGGDEWASVRQNLITTHTRSFSLESLKAGELRLAWRVYLDTVAWHFKLGRLRYLTAFPMLTILSSLRRRSAT